MDIATMVVSLLMVLQTPLFVAALVSSIWLSRRMRSGGGGRFPSNRLLAWVSFVTSLLLCIASAGQAILVLRMGMMGPALIPVLMAAVWGYFARRSLQTLKMLG